MRGRAIFGILTCVCICCLAWGVNAAEFCAGAAGELEDYLGQATANGESDIVKVQRGNYAGNFSFSSGEDTDIAVLGGYGPACTERVIDPANTVLDAEGIGTPLSFTKNSDGDVKVEGLTLKNGGYRGLYIRLYNESGGNVGSIEVKNNIITNNRTKGGIYISSIDNPSYTPGTIRLAGNVVAGNISDYGGGGLSMQIQWSNNASDIALVNNVIVGNIGSDISGGVFLNLGSETSVYLVNNTISGNHAFGASSDVGGAYLGNSGNCALYVYNNIIRGNTAESGVADIWFFIYGSARFGFNNNYSEIHGTWTDAENNLDVDPQFVLSGHWNDNGTSGDPSDDFWVDGDYHLGGASQCIDAGYESPPELPSTDFEGDQRGIDGNNDGVAEPDIGADEHTNYCMGDFEPDGDVDGSDLAEMIIEGKTLDLAVFAGEFGRNNCL